MSTRRAEPYFFDHGAQYFTARTQAFQDFIQPLIDLGIIGRWNPRYVKFNSNQVVQRSNWIDQEPRYVGIPGMNQVANYLAVPIDIRLNTRIITLEHKKRWQLTDDKGQHYKDFDWVVSTAPSPQSAELLPPYFKYHADISAIEMGACFSLMLGFKQGLALDFEAAHIINSDLSWIALNSHKPGRENNHTLMVHSSEQYAEAHIDDDSEAVMHHLINETNFITGHDVSAANYKTIHGWRYANNVKLQSHPTFLDQEHRLAACGDWCFGGHVEGAFTSAYHLANALKEKVL